MKLVNVRVREFRCVEDSGEFSLAAVTCLVGKNESGKTALLKALHKLNPGNSGEVAFVPSRDYPKRKWRPDVEIPKTVVPITTVWELDDADLRAIETELGPGVLVDRQMTLTKGYNTDRILKINFDAQKLFNNLVQACQLAEEDTKQIEGIKSVEEANQKLAKLTPRSAGLEKLFQVIQKKAVSGGNAAITALLSKRIPIFLYSDEYMTLPGTISIDALTDRKNQNKLDDRDRIFLALLSLAGTTLEKVQELATFEEFNASLRAVSNQITDQIFKYWSQNKHLDVEIRIDAGRSNDPAPFNKGWVFRTRITNRRHRADTSFDDRSRGFVWFFSFLVWYHHIIRQHGTNLIILLDEPGLSLHARAQADLLRFVNEVLRPAHQVVYTTHSPFMVDANNLLSARTVEDVVIKEKGSGEETLLGTQVSEKVLSTDPDTISPLQNALDYDLTQTLFIGKHTLLVEGPSDLLYLKWFSRQLQVNKRVGLDYRWNICIVGGVGRIPGFVSLFRGNGLHIAAIVDVQSGQKNKIETAKKLLPENHLVELDTYCSQTEADIEDLLGRPFYIALVKETLGLQKHHELPSIRPTSAPERVVKEVETHSVSLPPHYPEFNHFLPSEWLFQKADQGACLPGYQDAMNRFEKLFKDLNALM